MIEKEDKIKVSFSIKLTKIYTIEDIESFVELSQFTHEEKDSIQNILREMVTMDIIDAIRDGKGTFKIEG